MEKEAIFSMINAIKGQSVLDVGCGTGTFAIEFARRGAHVTGIDISKKMLAIAERKARKEKLKIAFKLANMEKLPYPDNSFNIIIAVTVLEFATNKEEAVTEMLRVLKPGGQLIIGALNRLSPWFVIKRIKGLFMKTTYRKACFMTVGNLHHLISQSNGKVKQWKTCVFFPPINHELVLQLIDWTEHYFQRFLPWFGAFLAVKATK